MGRWLTSSLEQSSLGFVRSMGEEARGERYRRKQKDERTKEPEGTESRQKQIYKRKSVSSGETGKDGSGQESKDEMQRREVCALQGELFSPPCSPGNASVQHTEAEQLQQISSSR